MKLEKILQWFLSAFVFLLPWQTVWIIYEWYIGTDKLQHATIQFFATEALLWVSICVFFAWYYKQYKARGSHPHFTLSKKRLFLISLLLFILYTSFSFLWSSEPELARQHSLYFVEALFLFLMIGLGPVDVHKLIKWFVLGSIAPACLGIVQFVTQQVIGSSLLGIATHVPETAGSSIVSVDEGRLLRAYGPMSHPNIFGGYLVVSLFGVFSIYRKTHKNVWLCVMPFIITALFFTFSRSAWLAAALLVVGTVAYAYKHKVKQMMYVGGGTIMYAVILSVVCSQFLVGRLLISNAHEVSSLTERVSYFAEAEELLSQNPILGVGPGNYVISLVEVYRERPAWEYQPVHNVFVLFVTELGGVGVGIVVLMIAFYVRVFVRNKQILYTILVVVGVFLPILLFDHYLYSSYIGLIFAGILAGLVTRLSIVHK